MIIIIIIKHTNPDSNYVFFLWAFTLGILVFSEQLSHLEASQELLDCCFCPHVLIIIITMSRATDNGVQRSIMKSSRGS